MQEVIDIKVTFVPLAPCQNLRSREGGFFIVVTLRRFISRRVTMPNCKIAQTEI